MIGEEFDVFEFVEVGVGGFYEFDCMIDFGGYVFVLLVCWVLCEVFVL